MFFCVITPFYKVKSDQLFHQLCFSLLKRSKIKDLRKYLEILEVWNFNFINLCSDHESWSHQITVKFHSGKSIHTLEKEYLGDLFLTPPACQKLFSFSSKKLTENIIFTEDGMKTELAFETLPPLRQDRWNQGVGRDVINHQNISQAKFSVLSSSKKQTVSFLISGLVPKDLERVESKT